MLGKAEYNLRKSALKRQYQEALKNVRIDDIVKNPHVAEAISKMEARKALKGNGAYVPMYTGAGGYLKDFGGAIGRDLGSAVGYGGLGRSIGRSLGSGLSRYTGMGDYGVNYNQLFPGLSSESLMTAQPIPGEFGGMCVDHTEFVANIYGNTSDFFNQTFVINPGLESSFPWLSQIACNFEEYKLEQLVYEFQATVTDQGVSSNGQVGTIIIATQYNASSSKFSDIQSMLQYDGVQTSMCTKNFVHGVECDPGQRAGDLHLYVRANPVVSGEDLKTYDHGILNIAQQGVAANLSNQLIGRLFVKYRVKLMKPRFYSGRGLAISKDMWLSSTSTSGGVTTGPSRDTFMGGTILYGQQNNIGCSIAKTAARQYTITLPATFSGNLKLLFSQDSNGGTTTFTGLPSFTVGGNGISFVSDLYGADNDSVNPTSTIHAYMSSMTCSIAHLRVVPASGGVNNTIVITGANAAADTALIDCYIELAEYNAGPSTPPVWVTSAGVVTTVGTS